MTHAAYRAKAFCYAGILSLCCGALTAAALDDKQPAAKPAEGDTTGEQRRFEPPTDDRLMQVLLDGREVGEHNFRFDTENGQLNVLSQAEFEVRVVFVTLFRYAHEARENWKNGCLVNVESSTNENGDKFTLASRQLEVGLEFDTNSRSHRLEKACPWSFAYWSPELRQRELLVNPQNGALVEVDFEKLGPREIKVGGSNHTFTAWKLRGWDVTESNGDNGEAGDRNITDRGDADVEIIVYYDEQDRWVGLDSNVGNGRTLQYRAAPGDMAFPRRI